MADFASPVWGNVSRYLLSEHYEQLPSNICGYYPYVAEYCMQWTQQVCYHPGLDVTMPYGTTLYAPASGTITCAGTGVGSGYDNGGCAAYPDFGPGGAGPAGAGRVELLLDDGTVVIYGHASRALALLGSRVEAGDPVAASGYMNSDHVHFETRVPDGSCNAGYAIVDPRGMPWISGPVVSVPFQTGDKIRVADPEGLNLRSEPTLAGGAGTILTTLPDGTMLDVQSGPMEADDLHWYKVKVASTGGWGWRAIGPTTTAVWEYELRNISPSGSPMFPEAAACNAAAGEHSALALAMAWVEQKYGTYQQIIPASFHNPMSLRGGGGWQQFASYAEGIAAWRRLLNDPSGPYAGTKTVAELIHIYAPSSDGNDEARYVADIDRLVTRYRALEGTTPGTPPNGDSPGETGYVAGDYCRLVNRFQVGDQIRVVDGPLNIRSQPSTAGTPDGQYLTGTEICVREGPVFAENHEWYRVDGYDHHGWVAGDLCAILERGGCTTTNGGAHG
jgi:hypothetical protein